MYVLGTNNFKFECAPHMTDIVFSGQLVKLLTDAEKANS